MYRGDGTFTTTTTTATVCWCRVLYVIAVSLSTVLPSPQRATKLSQTATEILYIEDGYPEHRTYKLEDFFWTGSGDGAPDESEKISTIYKTKTLMSTVYISVTGDNETITETSTPSECIIDCETISTPDGEIRPTPTIDDNSVTSAVTDGNTSNVTADRHFWLLTVIRTDGREPMVAILEKRLAKLYSVAFRRQQERHLGIAKRLKRDSIKFPSENKPVNVCIHTLARKDDTDEVEVLYHVLVSGKPVAAITAASDMRFVSDEEVATELGFPVSTKAEPYLKIERPQSLARVRDTWLFIGVAMTTIFLLLLMVTIFTFCLNKKKRSSLPVRPVGITNRQQVFERESVDGGVDNTGYVESHDDNKKSYQSGRRHHKGGSRLKNTASASNETLNSRLPSAKSIDSQSSATTSSSSSSSDASPLMLPMKHKLSQARKKSRQPEKRPSAINKALLQKSAAVGIESDSSSDKHGSETTLVKDSESRGKISPKSYLSMPSVKSFPKSSIPETLNKVLEPVSVLHLDMTDDVYPEQSPIYRPISGKKFIRHGSMGAEDPGVIGPVVWDLHCKRIQNDADNESANKGHSNRMRKRFNELLDDTFSLFGTSKDTHDTTGSHATSTSSMKHIDVRGHSAIVKPSADSSATSKQRPKTSDPRRVAPSPGLEPPRGAWSSTTPSPLIRPISAGPFHKSITKPVIEMERILADGTLPVTDPAVPLIAAIKTELEKCSLPGSTTNLADN